ncbi:nuclear transport factor 2 family protein [Zobellia amurskyensis]|uniref:Nuclear transport factor 2 family protein n=1 Tax=Zobellia amurskyensis TaxID=248905 RepID=A0A7X2ZRT7_9FLAO|nr:nuclear transport factor 2 family protein [Zobellia amurskyensis]MUH35232.1 nuclear transport factor 2 family protein [Zobellia amurskyensis]
MWNKILIYAFVGLFTVLSYSQSSGDKVEIENAVTKLYAAMVSKDKKELQKLTLDGLSYGHSSGTIENKEEYLEAIMTGTFIFSSIVAEDQLIIISRDTGIARHLFVATGTNKGKSANVRIGVMMIWQKKNGKWLLLARQAYKL